MCFIGGGAGMAPMRSHIFDQLKRIKSDRKMTYWYGARSKREMFYDEEFKELEELNPNFKYYVALSDPQPEDNWDSYVDFIHQVLQEEYLINMRSNRNGILFWSTNDVRAQKMLHDIGVEPDMIAYDDFGS